MFIRNVLLAAVAATTIGAAANASTMTIIESFNDFPNANNVDTYVSQGFDYTPLGTTVGQCFESICLREDQVNSDPPSLLTEITRSDDDQLFDFLGFYINFNGFTADSSNNFFIIESEGRDTVGLTTGQTFSEQMLDVYAVGNQSGEISQLAGGDTFDFSAVGYFVIFTGDQFDGVSNIRLSADNQGTVRFDCAAYSVPTGNSLSLDEISACEIGDDPEVEIPLPGSLPLLAGALGLTAIMRRRARAA